MIDIIENANELVKSLDEQAEIQLNICFNAGIVLEQLAQDVRRLVSELKEVRCYMGYEDELLF